MSKQCEYCHRRILTRKGAFVKHMRHCRMQIRRNNNTATQRPIQSLNPLLSLSSKDFVTSQEYECDMLEDHNMPHTAQEILANTNTDYNHDNESQSDDNILFDNSQDCNATVCPSGRNNKANSQFQIQLHDIIMKNKASLGMFDDICNLVNEFTSSPDFTINTKLLPRKSLIRSLEDTYKTTALRPKNVAVQLHDQSFVTVPVFDTKAMIIDLLTDDTLMNEINLAEGYDIFTGEIDMTHPNNSKYGEIHTGDAWLPARNRFCPRINGPSMPVALIVFGDKSHTDLHGTLALTPVIFTLTLFNRTARNNTKFWRPFGYMPNLSHNRGAADRRLTKDKIQDEHFCLSVLFGSLRDIHKAGGFELTVLGRRVHIKVWIHFFIGDTEGNNKWLGQYPGNREGVQQPYRDCKCSFDCLQLSNPSCSYVNLVDIRAGNRHRRNDEDKGVQYFRSVSRYDIQNALLHPFLPLSDDIHGPFKMMPPELLHTSGSGLIMYMFESLRHQLGAGINRDMIDQQHILVSNSLKRQSERDFPRGSMRNGLIDGTKCQSSERKGNLFRLLVIAYRTKAKNVLQNALGLENRRWEKFLHFIKMYLGMEEWFHDSNNKQQVRHARDSIGRVMQSLKRFFPRPENTNGYNIPKMHGMTKMQTYMTLFGSGINFYGGPGEAAHKTFVKSAGQKTQRRISEFAQQTAYQYYCMLVSSRASNIINPVMKNLSQANDDGIDNITNIHHRDDIRIELSGRYEITVSTAVLEQMSFENTVNVKWLSKNSEKSGNLDWSLNKDLVKCLHRHISQQTDRITTVIGYTRARIISNGDPNDTNIFYCHPCYQGECWYDWAMIQFEELVGGEYLQRNYPARLLGFITTNSTIEAIVQCAKHHLSWDYLLSKFIVSIEIGDDFDESFVVVPIEAIVHPLCVIPDDGDNPFRFFVILPRRNWSNYFGQSIET